MQLIAPTRLAPRSAVSRGIRGLVLPWRTDLTSSGWGWSSLQCRALRARPGHSAGPGSAGPHHVCWRPGGSSVLGLRGGRRRRPPSSGQRPGPGPALRLLERLPLGGGGKALHLLGARGQEARIKMADGAPVMRRMARHLEPPPLCLD
ncbi:hypothetical protein NDU88_006693 [Pleurodeles waltl]|uniref:Uncharacterized protein n=1 Tax=Pleurodeles waltl TaxID=8319 RepID=A0AAV7QLX7_PLEWA|nr:hypothetical protein NDU88_006693 [Pleurodeles waltl]